MEENLTVDPKDAQDNKVMGILAYLGILVLVPILAAKESPFARYHSNQGLILLIVAAALAIVINILSRISLSLWLVFTLLGGILWLGVGVFAILGIINAVKGEMKELPLIGKYKILK